MLGQISETVLSTTGLLWIGGAVLAISMLAATINRRRTGLIDVLRKYVKGQLPPDESDGPKP